MDVVFTGNVGLDAHPVRRLAGPACRSPDDPAQFRIENREALERPGDADGHLLTGDQPHREPVASPGRRGIAPGVRIGKDLEVGLTEQSDRVRHAGDPAGHGAQALGLMRGVIKEPIIAEPQVAQRPRGTDGALIGLGGQTVTGLVFGLE